MPEQQTHFLGPRQGYYGRAEYDHSAGVFRGHVTGIHDDIAFEAVTVGRLAAAFHEAIDEYLDSCAKHGREPNRMPNEVMVKRPGKPPMLIVTRPPTEAESAMVAEIAPALEAAAREMLGDELA